MLRCDTVALDGGMIKDMQKNAMILSCTIDPGASVTIEIMSPAALSSKGGMITLLNADGVKVHRVSYTSGPVR